MQLIEFVHSEPNTLRVDEARGVIHGVKVLGPVSANRRRYTESAMRSALPKYSGVNVSLDHNRSTTERSAMNRVGWLDSPRLGKNGSGIYADLHLLTKHPYAPVILEAALKHKKSFCLSHEAEGEQVRKDGEDLIEEITAVREVCIVSDGATTSSLAESAASRRQPITLERAKREWVQR